MFLSTLNSWSSLPPETLYFTSALVSFCKSLKLYSKKFAFFLIEKYLIWKICNGIERNMDSVIRENNGLV